MSKLCDKTSIQGQKKQERFTNLRVILAHRGHANLLCIVPSLAHVPPKRVQSHERTVKELHT